jgi:hypothetical protein
MFRVIYSDTGLPALSIAIASASEASAIRDCLATPRPLRIARIVDNSWRIREALRFDNGTYKALPAIIMQAEWFVGSEADRNHFAHRANSDSAKIAFTESAEKGMDDKQTVVPINRYLARYFGDRLRSEEIAKISALYTAPEHTLTIGNDAQAFRFAYSDQEVKSESSMHYSCMRYTKHYFGTPCHPAETYAAGDLAIAYIVCPDDSAKVIARALIWPDKLRFVRVYGIDETIRVALAQMLEDRGYCRADDWRGARIRAVEFGGKVVVPYIDGEITSLEYDDDDDVMTVSRHGSVDGSSTRGWAHSNSGRISCGHCSDRVCEDDTHHVGNEIWCDDCVSDSAVFCQYNEEYFPDSDSFSTVQSRHGEQIWHVTAVSRHAFYCDRTEERYHDGYFTSIEVNTRHGVREWCEEETGDFFFHCEKTDEAFSCEDFQPITVETSEGPQVWESKQAVGLVVYGKHDGAAYLPECVPDGVEITSLPFGTVEDARQMELI